MKSIDPTCGSAKRHMARGFTVIELIIVLSVIGIMMSIATLRFRGLQNELENAARETSGFVRQARAEAMSTTSAYRVRSVSASQLGAEFAASCNADDDDWQVDRSLTTRLEGRVSYEGLEPDSVLVCFDSRGVGNRDPAIRLRERNGNASDVEVFVGGAVRIVDVVEGL